MYPRHNNINKFWRQSVKGLGYIFVLTCITVLISVTLYVWFKTTRVKHTTHLPVLPSHSFTDLSNDALAMIRPSGEKATSLTCCMCPVMRATDLLLVSAVHRHMVWSSEHDTIRSPAFYMPAPSQPALKPCPNSWILCILKLTRLCWLLSDIISMAATSQSLGHFAKLQHKISKVDHHTATLTAWTNKQRKKVLGKNISLSRLAGG